MENETNNEVLKMEEHKRDGSTVVDLVKHIENKGPIQVYVSHKNNRGKIMSLIELDGDGVLYPHINDPLTGSNCGSRTGSVFTIQR